MHWVQMNPQDDRHVLGHRLRHCFCSIKQTQYVFSSRYAVFAGTKQHMQPLNAFSGLLIQTKRICSWSSAQKPAALQTS